MRTKFRWRLLPLVFATVPLMASRQGAPGAQPLLGTIRGTVFDSLTSKPIAGALIEVSGSDRMITTDPQGRFRLDSVAAGPHRLTFSAPALDSIGLFGFGRDVEIRAGTEQVISLATPSFRTMYARLCSPLEKPVRDSAIVFGTVSDAATGARIDSARVQFSWFGVVGGSSVRVEETAREARTMANGDYGICGLPSDVSLSTRALADGAASGSVQTSIGEARIVRVDLAVSAELHAAEVAHAAKVDSMPLRAHGRSTVRGMVKDERGRPLVNALVVLAAADTAVRTDSVGRFMIGNAPAGTQQIEVRQLGLGAVSRVVQLQSDNTVDVSFVLSPTNTLSKVNVRGNRIGFDQSAFLLRKKAGFAHYIEAAEIAKRPDMASALRRMPGLMIRQAGFDFNIYSTRPSAISGPCTPTIVVDGVPQMRHQNGSTIPLAGRAPEPSNAESLVAKINPKDVLALEYFANEGTGPTQYSVVGNKSYNCGMLLVWTKAAQW